ncbi:CBS domain-containing protein [Glycomyces buryatensis]|uniref:CBS domain-containing protein n=1 Tax=Glycomyces buryatensis TaxID=2570927 RepID=A0A4S8Q850_9ACTN|nr:CBS domain-containing protein [Glycomyces buryatensis]THV39541.1 CBS domain-containing protein [Glycomyces buryatensis]
MAKARDLMHPGVACVRSDDTAANAARMMAEMDVGCLPICGAEDNKIHGMVTDRDLVLNVMATGKDAELYTVDQLPQNHLILADADEDIEITIAKMKEHQIHRIPVLEGKRLVGIIALADVARRAPVPVTGELVGSISQ